MPSSTHTRFLFPVPAEERSRLEPEAFFRRTAGVTFDLSQGLHVITKEDMPGKGGQTQALDS